MPCVHLVDSQCLGLARVAKRKDTEELTTSIGHDLEDRRVDLGLTALFYSTLVMPLSKIVASMPSSLSCQVAAIEPKLE